MKIDFKEIFEEYAYNPDIFSEDSQEVRALKYVIFNDLTEIDRRVILLYAELGSLRKTAKLLGVSTSSVYNLIKEIRNKITKRI